jgi:hypothetical protein
MKRALFALTVMFALATLFWDPVTAGASTDFILTGRILDAAGKPVEGAEVFVYDSVQTRRPADFISPKTDGEGLYRFVLPARRYWVVARVRSGAKYGPLLFGGKHSGAAVEIEATAGGELVLDFTVADVREMTRDQKKAGEGYRKVEGRIQDRDGRPARGAYVFARQEKNGARLPDFISPWSDEEGGYTLFLPPGRYCLGGAITYPPEDGAPCQELFLDSAKIDITSDIRLNCHDNNEEDGNRSSSDSDSHD